MHQATAHALTALREAHPALAVIVDDCFRPGQVWLQWAAVRGVQHADWARRATCSMQAGCAANH